jgi:hypothetical protein
MRRQAGALIALAAMALSGCIPDDGPVALPGGGAGSQSPDGATQGSGGDASTPVAPGNPPGDDGPTVADCEGAALPEQGLLLWLRADLGVTVDGDNVSQWENQGSAGGAFTPGSAPQRVGMAVNGHAVVRFNGTTTLSSQVAVNGLDEMTLALVSATTQHRAPGSEWCQDFGLHVTENGCSGTYNLPILWPETGGWGMVFVGPVRDQVAYRFGPGSKTYSDDLHAIDHDPQVAWKRPSSIGADFTHTMAIKTYDTITLRVDGEEVMERPIPGGAGAISNTASTVHLGSGIRDDLRWTGDIAEVIAYNRALSAAERVSVEAYVQCRYALF